MKKNVLLVGFAAIISVLFLLVLTQAIGMKFTKKELAKSCQPEEISYDQWSPYCVWLHRVAGPIDTTYMLSIGLDSEYGMHYAYPDLYVADPDELKELKVEWKDDAVEIYIVGTDTKLVVPAAEFKGGR